MALLNARQRLIIRGAIHAARKRYRDPKVAREAALIAVMMMFPESGCRVLANANVPESKKYPHDRLNWTHDGLGHDHASCGPAQQQTGCKWTTHGCGPAMNQSTMGTPNGWGTPKELMDPATSITKFFRALDKRHRHLGWRQLKPWVAIQNVQRSAYDGRARSGNNFNGQYGGNYYAARNKAKAAVALLWPTTSPVTPPKGKPAPRPPAAHHPAPRPAAPRPPARPSKPKAKYVKVKPGQTLSTIARAAGVRDWRTLVKLNSKAHPSLVRRPDYIKVGWKLRVR